MNILVSAIVGELISRSTSFLADKYCQQQPGIREHLKRLQAVLLRIDAIVEEADGRHITNQGMLRQLKMLRKGMYRGHYLLDTFRYQPLNREVGCSSSALSISCPAKRLCFSGTGSTKEALTFGTNIVQEVQEIISTLEYTVSSMKEFAIFLLSCPRMLHQPYSTYLLLDNCLFGRQAERERVLNFLLHTEGSSGGADLAVLPVVGPIGRGKSTLLEHVCKDERVRDRFSMILLYSENRLKDQNLGQNGLIKHQNCTSQNRLLIIVEVAEEIEDGIWGRLKSSTICMAPSGSKIIITSRSNKIVSLGTTEALRLDYLTPEAYWYFFKMLAFQSANIDEHSKMASMAMEIALELGDCFTGAHVVAGLLRDNFNPQFWSTMVKAVRADKQKNMLSFDEHPTLLIREHKPVYCKLMKGSRYLLICSYHQSDSTEEAPKISMQDILLGSGDTLPRGRFEALAWKSRIAPYNNYIISCMIHAPHITVGSKKRHLSKDI